MKILIAHTYYISRGGEDLVFETEKRHLKESGIQINTIEFKNATWTFLKFIMYPFNLFAFFKMLRAIRKYKPDIVHIHNWHFGASPSIIVACKISGIPTVQTLHNHRMVSHFDILNQAKGKLSEVFLNKKQQKDVHKSLNLSGLIQNTWLTLCSIIYKKCGFWKLVDQYIVLTESSRNLYASDFLAPVSPRIVVKSNFINGDNLVLKPKKDYLLYVGRLTREKGIHILISAIENTNLKLKIIGDGPLRKEIEQITKKHSNIEYLGFHNFSFIKEVMAESLATIFPSVTLEGMPMTIIESFACGTPVIASKYSAMQNMITEGYNGFHFEVGNIEELRDKAIKISNISEEEMRYLSENARNTYLQNYSPVTNIKKLTQIYKDLIIRTNKV